MPVSKHNRADQHENCKFDHHLELALLYQKFLIVLVAEQAGLCLCYLVETPQDIVSGSLIQVKLP